MVRSLQTTERDVPSTEPRSALCTTSAGDATAVDDNDDDGGREGSSTGGVIEPEAGAMRVRTNLPGRKSVSLKAPT